MRIKYISRLISDNVNQKLKFIMLYNLNHYENMKLGLDIFRILPVIKSLKKLPLYYQEMLISWRKISMGRLLPPQNREDILRQPLFHNPFIINEENKSLYNKTFIDGDIVYMSNLMYEMIPNHLPAVAVYEALTMFPNIVITVDDVAKCMEQIMNAIPNDWLVEIFSSDKIVSTHCENSLQLTIQFGTSLIDASNLSARRAVDLLRNSISVTPKGEQYWKRIYPSINFVNR